MQALFATLSLLPCSLYRALTCLNFTYGSTVLSDSLFNRFVLLLYMSAILSKAFFRNLSNVYLLLEQNLYNAHVRKVVVMGLAPIGCAPYNSWLYHSNNGQCATINDVIFCDAFEVSMDIIQNHDHYGERSL